MVAELRSGASTFVTIYRGCSACEGAGRSSVLDLLWWSCEIWLFPFFFVSFFVLGGPQKRKADRGNGNQ